MQTKQDKEAVQRMVADMVTDEMLTTPVKDLSNAEVAIMYAAFNGKHGWELIERMDNLLDKSTDT